MRVGLLLSLLVAPSAAAQAPWTHDYGKGGFDDVVEAPDGGFVTVGHYESPLLPDDRQGGLIAKVDSQGDVVWQVVLGSPDFDSLARVAPVSSGGYLATGSIIRSPSAKPWVVRLAEDGTILWQRAAAQPRDLLLFPQPGPGGSTYLSGEADPGQAARQAVFKIDATGAVEWGRAFPAGSGRPASVATLGGGVILATTTAAGFAQVQLHELAADGTVLSQWELGDPSRRDRVTALALGPAGSLFVIGTVLGNGPRDWIASVDLAGRFNWGREWMATNATLSDPIATPDGGVVIVAAGTPGGVGMSVNVKLDANGTHAWTLEPEPLLMAKGRSRGGFIGRASLPVGLTWHAFLGTFDPSGTPSSACSTVDVRSLQLTSHPLSLMPVVNPPVSDTLALVDHFTWTWTPSLSPSCAACPRLTCGEIITTPDVACAGEPVTLSFDIAGGQGAVTVEWDLDGDGTPDAVGNPIDVVLAAGFTRIDATVRDECAAPVQECSDSLFLSVPDVVGEVSDVASGASPLTVAPGPTDVTVEVVPGATEYHVTVGRIGNWYAPERGLGAACRQRSWSANGDGTLTLSDVLLGAPSWVVVTAANDCFEGSAGRDSFGRERSAGSGWDPCVP